ncbi:MAG: hypothetical protein ACP5O3_03885 [Candidatus Micrarchaeia archaeon]|jgi:ketopantoate hydroxymethyltransferase
MKTTIIFDESKPLKQAAQAIAEGARKAGAEATLTDSSKEKPLAADLYFAGIEKNERAAQQVQALLFSGASTAAIFCLEGVDARKTAEFFSSQGIRVIDWITFHPKRSSLFGEKKISDEEIVRAQAFGERVTNKFQQKRVTQPSEKHKISGYFKPRQQAFY